MPLPLPKAGALNVAQTFAQALQLQNQGRLQEAERLYSQILFVRPDHVDALHMMGVIRLAKGQPAEALQFVAAAMQFRKPTPVMHYNQGLILKALVRAEEALASFEQAIKLKSKFAEAHNDRGVLLALLDRQEEAIEAFRKAAMAKPDFAEAHYNRSASLIALGRNDEAMKAVERALALNSKHVKSHNQRGFLLIAAGRHDEALASFDRALAIDPNFVDAYNNYGRALFLLNRFDEALAHLEPALERRPDDADAHYLYGRVLLEFGRNDEALAALDRAETLRRANAETRVEACFAELPIIYGDEDEVIRRRAAYEQKLSALSADVEAGILHDIEKVFANRQPFYLAYQGRNDRDLQALYGGMISHILERQYPKARLPPPPKPNERVRVGIVSAFFSKHSNWKIPIKGWLSQLDRNRFKFFCYHLAPAGEAETNAAELCERYVRGVWNLADWRREILADAPHVLIYPGLMMDKNSIQLAAQRLAPVQCNSWGHPETSGLPTLDYFLSSDLMEPPDAAEHYTERLVRLPNLSVYYEPVATEAAALTRQELGLRADAPTFWCGQSLFKYLPQFDDVFPRIAKLAPDSQFAFLHHHSMPRVTKIFRERLERAFAGHGLNASDHCVFLRRLSQDEYVAAMGLCDVFLDSIDWSGCNSALESLPHDLPIVTVPGTLMRGRHSTAILQMMGVTETIASTVDDYVAIAGRLANAPHERQALSRRIAQSKLRVYRDRACITALEDFLDRVARQPGA
jgi:protein O-GlcNAc transferase